MSQPNKVVKIVTRPDGKLRVVLFTDERGQFGYEEQHFADNPMEMCWIPCRKQTITVCDSLETAEREAKGRIEWLAQQAG